MNICAKCARAGKCSFQDGEDKRAAQLRKLRARLNPAGPQAPSESFIRSIEALVDKVLLTSFFSESESPAKKRQLWPE